MTEGRIPPQSIEAELSVLGAMMLKPAATTQAIELLRADEFYRQAHRAVFETMEELGKNGEPGGKGAVREVCELILDAQGKLDAALAPYLPADGQ